jgi:hypothetical protein
VFDIFTGYAENGPDYIYSLLTGYEDPPEGEEAPLGLNYNPYFIAGEWIAMAQPLFDGMHAYEDGSPETISQYAQDVAAFMMWAAEPHLNDRKEMGFPRDGVPGDLWWSGLHDQAPGLEHDRPLKSKVPSTFKAARRIPPGGFFVGECCLTLVDLFSGQAPD